MITFIYHGYLCERDFNYLIFFLNCIIKFLFNSVNTLKFLNLINHWNIIKHELIVLVSLCKLVVLHLSTKWCCYEETLPFTKCQSTFFICKYENVLSFTLTARNIINHIPFIVNNSQTPSYFLHPDLFFNGSLLRYLVVLS